MKRIFILLTVALLCVPVRAQEPLSPEVNRMIEYLMLADDAGLDVPLYIMELSDQLAMLCLTDYMNKEILEQGQAAAELYGHPLVCMNYAACLMKQRKYGSALHYLNIAWKQDRNNAMIATNMARCHYELGDDKNCEAFVNKALALDPDYGLALQLKATLLLNRGNQEAAVEYVLRSALDVWNGISVRQFTSLLKSMERLYERYYEAVPVMMEKLVALPTPLDGMEKYFKPIVRAGRTPGEEPEPAQFPYPVSISSFQYSGDPDDGIYDVFDAFFDNEYAAAAREVDVPMPSYSYPAEYWGVVGGDRYLPDSRAVLMTMVVYYYHQIKLLEAMTKFEREQDDELDPLRERTRKLTDELEGKMTDECNKVGVTQLMMGKILKNYGDQIYAANRNLVNITMSTRLRYWKKYMRPALEAYSSDIKTCLTYVADNEAFEYVQTRYDKDIASIYERGELDYIGSLQGDVDLSKGFSALGEDILEWYREAEQEYLEELARTRNKRLLEWDTNEKLRAAGMEGLNRNREPVPSFGIKIGNTGIQVGVDRSNRVHIRVDGSDGSVNKIYNMETGASSTTVLHEVKDETPQIPGALKTYLQDKITHGHFSYNSGAMEGKQVVTDGRGNIIESSHVREETTSVTMGGEVGSVGASGTFTSRTRAVKPKRYGASVSSTTRATLTGEAGFSESGFNIVSVGASVSQGGL